MPEPADAYAIAKIRAGFGSMQCPRCKGHLLVTELKVDRGKRLRPVYDRGMIDRFETDGMLDVIAKMHCRAGHHYRIQALVDGYVVKITSVDETDATGEGRRVERFDGYICLHCGQTVAFDLAVLVHDQSDWPPEYGTHKLKCPHCGGISNVR